MKILLIFALTIIFIFLTHVHGAVYDTRYEYVEKDFEDRILKSPIRRNYINGDDYKYRDSLSREYLGPRDSDYERIRIERTRKFPYGYHPRDHNVFERDNIYDRRDRDHWDYKKRIDYEHDNARYIRRQNPNQFWKNGRKYEMINGKPFEVFNVGTH
uniref:Uncharacterized protein n=1 Tax=Strongyloides venezuelensis TaxID=75913 RepID=A0A0K0FB77_STRVS